MSPWKAAGLGAIALVALLLGSTWHVAESMDAHAQEGEIVALYPGCNPVAITFPDGTAIATIATAVSPPEILIAIWRFQNAAGMWQGYSPQFPEASDLTEMDFLDVGFLCVNAAGTFTRPLI